MRIISGFLKGKKINYLKNSTTRPLKDSVKENIFNILAHSKLIKIKLESSNILDLYSGVGSFGLECISRGAKKVTFIEKNNLASNVLKENLQKLSIINKSQILNGEVIKILNKNLDEKFNILFLDPPFAEKNFIDDLNLMKKLKLFHDEHIVIIHREKRSQDNLDKLINIIYLKEYGRSKIIFGLFK